MRRPASRGKAKRQAPARAPGADSHEGRHLDPGKPPSLTCPRRTEIRRLGGIRLAVFSPGADPEVSEDHGRQSRRGAENAPGLLAKCSANAQREAASIGPKPARVPSSNAAARDSSANADGLTPTALGGRSREVMSTPGARDANVGCRSRVEASWRRARGKPQGPAKARRPAKLKVNGPDGVMSHSPSWQGCSGARMAERPRLRPLGGSPGEPVGLTSSHSIQRKARGLRAARALTMLPRPRILAL